MYFFMVGCKVYKVISYLKSVAHTQPAICRYKSRITQQRDRRLPVKAYIYRQVVKLIVKPYNPVNTQVSLAVIGFLVLAFPKSHMRTGANKPRKIWHAWK